MKSKNHLLHAIILGLSLPLAVQAQGSATSRKPKDQTEKNRVYALLNQASQNLSNRLENLDSLYEAEGQTSLLPRIHDAGSLKLEGYDFTIPGALGVLLKAIDAITPKLIAGEELQEIPLYTELELSNCTLKTDDGADFELFRSIAQQKLNALSLEGTPISPNQLTLLLRTLGPDNYNSRIRTLKATLSSETNPSETEINQLRDCLRTMIQSSPVQSLMLKENSAPNFFTNKDLMDFMNVLFSSTLGNISLAPQIYNLNPEESIAQIEAFDAQRKHVVIEFKNEIWTLYPSLVGAQIDPCVIRQKLPENATHTESSKFTSSRKRARETDTGLNPAIKKQSVQEAAIAPVQTTQTEAAPRPIPVRGARRPNRIRPLPESETIPIRNLFGPNED